ncbi:MAG: class I SAM-dependent methyltransferase [Rhizobiaceae bacterium]
MPDNQHSFEQLSKVMTFWDEKYGEKFKGYVHPYRERSTFDNLANFYRAIAEFNDTTSSTVACDLGCWLGFPCLLENADTGCTVYGIEIQESFTETAREWSAHIDARNLRFHAMREGVVPLPGASVDWVLVNQVLCNALADTFPNSIREAARILKPGGTLIICDSNNPYHEPVRARLKRTYHNAETGNGSLEAPAGHNFRARKTMIQAVAPGLSAESVSMLALGTCYMHGLQIRAAVQDFVHNGRKPVSLFNPDTLDTPLLPHNGAALGNLTNPYLLARIAQEAGLQVTINTALTRQPLSPSDLYDSLQNSGSFYVIAEKKA